jgi:monovalent cation/proton antiporter MnhG/PhaG subunit
MAGTLLDVLGIGLIGLGLVLATIALYGLLRLPDSEILSQLHAAGLLTGPAVMLVLLAAVATGEGEVITSAALVIVFLAVTAPLSSHAIARAAHRRDGPGEEDGAADAGRR